LLLSFSAFELMARLLVGDNGLVLSGEFPDSREGGPEARDLATGKDIV
jgi:hypothetical protein